MKKFLPAFLALCLGIAPVFSQDFQTPAAETVSVEPGQLEAESLEVLTQTAKPEAEAAPAVTAEQAMMLGSDVPELPMLRAFGGLGLVLCLLIGAYFGIRKFAPGYFPKTLSGGGKNLKIVESIGMGDRRSIALVEVGGKRFLVGSTPQQINLLTTLPEHFSLVAEEEEVNVVKVAGGMKEEAVERQTFRNLFDKGKKRPAMNSGKVLPEEVRQKMRRLREALENR